MNIIKRDSITILFNWKEHKEAFKKCQDLKAKGYKELKFQISDDNNKESFIELAR